MPRACTRQHHVRQEAGGEPTSDDTDLAGLERTNVAGRRAVADAGSHAGVFEVACEQATAVFVNKTDVQAGGGASLQGRRAAGAGALARSGCRRRARQTRFLTGPGRQPGTVGGPERLRGPSCRALAWRGPRGPLSPSPPVRAPVPFRGLHPHQLATSQGHLRVPPRRDWDSPYGGHRHPVHIFVRSAVCFFSKHDHVGAFLYSSASVCLCPFLFPRTRHRSSHR